MVYLASEINNNAKRGLRRLRPFSPTPSTIHRRAIRFAVGVYAGAPPAPGDGDGKATIRNRSRRRAQPFPKRVAAGRRSARGRRSEVLRRAGIIPPLLAKPRPATAMAPRKCTVLSNNNTRPATNRVKVAFLHFHCEEKRPDRNSSSSTSKTPLIIKERTVPTSATPPQKITCTKRFENR